MRIIDCNCSVKWSDLHLVQQEVVSKRDDYEEHLHADSRVPCEHHFVEQHLGVMNKLIAPPTLLHHKDEIKDLKDDTLAVHEQNDESNQVNVTEWVVFVDHVGRQPR